MISNPVRSSRKKNLTDYRTKITNKTEKAKSHDLTCVNSNTEKIVWELITGLMTVARTETKILTK